MNNKPTRCWFCAKLGKCQILKPCKDFVKYDYNNSTTKEKVAKLCGVGVNTLFKWLKDDPDYALKEIHKRSGLNLEYVATNKEGTRHKLVKKEEVDL